MENHFTLAHKWGCVLLPDEADVFLAKRDLYYPKLSKKPVIQIFKNNFDRIKAINDDRQSNGLSPFLYMDSKKKVLGWKYFKTVAEASIQFNQYLHASHGFDEEKVAKRDLMRASTRDFESLRQEPLLESSSEDSSEDERHDDGKAQNDKDSGDSSDSESTVDEKKERKKTKDKKQGKKEEDAETDDSD
ncbi:hypothetical protein B0H63DRAFT_528725 [Podospora didyma]|uniref:Uncharacterized protein n=1 Tax=Podospora didyma TaxID=330526 RepID=A0AAE0K1J6_9PEZI|nr:hypothetical protein B0H63DRAFT_528725 [Podospora didyma]